MSDADILDSQIDISAYPLPDDFSNDNDDNANNNTNNKNKKKVEKVEKVENDANTSPGSSTANANSSPSISSNGGDSSNTNINDKFDNLTYEDIQVNLRLLSDLKEAEKLMIDGKFITVDQRYLQNVRRWLSCDSRHRSILFIDHVVNETQRYCKDLVNLIGKNVHHKENMEKLLGLQALLNGSLIGLGRLASTYKDDKLNRARLDTIQDKIKTFCDLDLKKAIQNHHNYNK